MKLPDEVRAAFRREGRKVGRERARRLSSEARRTIARRAALRRWIRVRFGNASFAALGLPGGAMIDKGLDDLAAGQVTPECLVVSLAAPRLQREGVPLPPACIPDAEQDLLKIAIHTIETWGVEQADVYESALLLCLRAISRGDAIVGADPAPPRVARHSLPATRRPLTDTACCLGRCSS